MDGYERQMAIDNGATTVTMMMAAALPNGHSGTDRWSILHTVLFYPALLLCTVGEKDGNDKAIDMKEARKIK